MAMVSTAKRVLPLAAATCNGVSTNGISLILFRISGSSWIDLYRAVTSFALAAIVNTFQWDWEGEDIISLGPPKPTKQHSESLQTPGINRHMHWGFALNRHILNSFGARHQKINQHLQFLVITILTVSRRPFSRATCNGLRPLPLSFLQKDGIMAMVSTAKRVLPFAAATCSGVSTNGISLILFRISGSYWIDLYRAVTSFSLAAVVNTSQWDWEGEDIISLGYVMFLV
nr:hypothetical protein Iba_chr09fCG9500 [Ipomoea batatas]